MPQEQAKKTPAQTATENVERMGRFASTARDKTKGGSVLSRVGAFAREEQERDRKAKAEALKKRTAGTAPKPGTPKSTEPSKGFFGRMMDKYYYGKKEEK